MWRAFDLRVDDTVGIARKEVAQVVSRKTKVDSFQVLLVDKRRLRKLVQVFHPVNAEMKHEKVKCI